MKIFLVSQGIYPQRGGVELHVYRLAKGLLQLGHEVWAIVQAGEFWTEFHSGLHIFYGSSPGHLQSLLKAERPDVVHAHGARSVFVARCLLAAQSAGIHTVFTPHCFYPAQDLTGKLKRFAFDRTLGLRALRASHRIIALAENDYSDALALGAKASQLTIIPNSIVLPRPLPDQEADRWRKHHGLKKFLLAVGRLDRVKRGDFLIRSMGLLPPDLSLVFAGPDAGCLDGWSRLAQTMGLNRSIHFLGEISENDLKAAYQSCIAVVLASAYEGLPTVILEAMALGAPVVASATGGTRCLIRDAENGFLFNHDDAAGFAGAVKRALAPEADIVIERARLMVAAEYSWEINMPKIFSLYRQTTDMEASKAVVTA